MQRFHDALFLRLGLVVQPSKCECWIDEAHIASLDAHRGLVTLSHLLDGALTLHYGIMCYGVPIGSEEYVKLALASKCDEIASISNKLIATLSSSHKQQLWLLTLFSTARKFVYFACHCYPDQTRDACTRFDAIIHTQATHALGVSLDDDQLATARLAFPRCSLGAGLRRMEAAVTSRPGLVGPLWATGGWAYAHRRYVEEHAPRERNSGVCGVAAAGDDSAAARTLAPAPDERLSESSDELASSSPPEIAAQIDDELVAAESRMQTRRPKPTMLPERRTSTVRLVVNYTLNLYHEPFNPSRMENTPLQRAAALAQPSMVLVFTGIFSALFSHALRSWHRPALAAALGPVHAACCLLAALTLIWRARAAGVLVSGAGFVAAGIGASLVADMLLSRDELFPSAPPLMGAPMQSDLPLLAAAGAAPPAAQLRALASVLYALASARWFDALRPVSWQSAVALGIIPAAAVVRVALSMEGSAKGDAHLSLRGGEGWRALRSLATPLELDARYGGILLESAGLAALSGACSLRLLTTLFAPSRRGKGAQQSIGAQLDAALVPASHALEELRGRLRALYPLAIAALLALLAALGCLRFPGARLRRMSCS
ncbi:hypothetical protein T492DRAFT_861422 [Pavlovales sp. CCMP2436]|nr:hypothetical protein T492DRAFT_861422 [Pavlovales sp. CCMP2436]